MSVKTLWTDGVARGQWSVLIADSLTTFKLGLSK